MADTEETQGEETQPENQEAPEQTEEQPETEETPESEGEAAKADDAKEEPGEAPKEDAKAAEEKHRRAGGWQRKIERLEREKEQLYQQLIGRASTQGKGDDKPKDAAAQVEDYVAGLVEQRLKEREERERQTRAQAEFARRTQEVRAQNPDFDEVMEAAGDAQASDAVRHALLTSEHGPAIMYQLAKSPGELDRLNRLAPLDAAREIGRLEAKASSTPAPKVAPKPASRPPAPPTTVGGQASSTRSLEDMPLSEYKRAYRSGRR